MLVIPAIDLKDGKCVRLFQGDMDQSTVYGEEPLLMARRWVKEGARLLHLIDLNGAVEGTPTQADIIGSMIGELKTPVQVGGGIRTIKTIEAYLAMGVSRVILGTIACEEPELLKTACELFPGRVGVGIDARDGWVATRGWRETSGVSAIDLAKRSESAGVAFLVCTDISRDGTQQGVNAGAMRAIADAVSVPVIASGGVASLEDIVTLKSLGKIEGVIIGRALYTGSIGLPEAIMAGGCHDAC
jgi:phosphoribosylformimino-5-aminoimidazole carboxamide ribotide isomerase